jgi:hypothetical protein
MEPDPDVLGPLAEGRPEAGRSPVDELALRLAKNLQGGFTKQTTGTPRKWRDVPPDQRRIWLRLARTAMKIVMSDLAATAPPADAPGPARSGPRSQ